MTATSVEALVARVQVVPPRLGSVRLVALDGPSGSGKSTLADALVAGLRCAGLDVALVRTDYFATWDEPVQWWPRLVDGVLMPLAQGVAGRYRCTEWPEGRPVLGDWVDVDVPDVLVCEGVSAARRSISDQLSLAIWVELPDSAQRRERAVERDGEQVRGELRRWQRFEQLWFAIDDTRNRADICASSGSGALSRPSKTRPFT